MFIKHYEIEETDITIDVRTKEEYEKATILEHNITIIDKTQHDFLKKHIYLAIPIVLTGLIQNHKAIKKDLLALSTNNNRLIIGCSQGRLRSPFVCIYARLLGLNAKVLKYGIKPHFQSKTKTLKNLFGFLEI